MDPPSEEVNFCDDSKRGMKRQMVARYNWHKGYVDISDSMANSYSMCRRTFKWTTKLLFHLLDLTVPSSWILLSSCGAKCIHKDFRLLLVRNLIEEGGRSHYSPTSVWLEGQVRLQQMLWGWTAAITSIGQQNTKTVSTAAFVQSGASERPLYTNVPNVMWVCVWCRVSPITTQIKFVKQFYYNKLVCVRCVVAEERLKVHGTSAAARIMWVIKYLHYIL